MGIATEYLQDLITKQIANHGLVVWFDPEKQYENLASNLAISETTIICYEGSFFALRHAVQPLLNDENPPRLLIYVPLDQGETHNALVELATAGVTLKPGQQPPSRNTRLSIIARNALRQVMHEDIVASIERQVEEGKLTLAELDALGEKAGDGVGGVIVTIYESNVPHEVALAFLTRPDLDGTLLAKSALPELIFLLESAFDLALDANKPPAALRTEFARQVLATELITTLGEHLPASLTTVEVTQKPAARETTVNLVQTWRLRRDLRASYVALSAEASQQLGLANIDFSLPQLRQVESFLVLEQKLQQAVELALLKEPTDGLVELSQARQSRFWAETEPNIQACWALVATTGQLLLEAWHIEKALAGKPPTAAAMLEAYTDKERPWCLLDTHHRHMERRYHNFDFGFDKETRLLEQLVFKARAAYMNAGAMLAERFQQSYQKALFDIPGVMRQFQIFNSQVKPAMKRGKTAYIWVDALRYEMARELAQTLGDQFEVAIAAALATPPTITEIGMAALLPQKDAPAVVPAGPGKLALRIGDTEVRTRPERVRFLHDHAGATVFDARLDELLPKPKKAVQEGIQQAGLVLITSQEIDALCEGDNIPLARRTMDSILHELGRACQVLAELGVQTIILTADHGYLFGDELSLDMKIDAPGGDTIDLHRRVWIGHGGAAHPAYLRANLSDFGLGGELEMATPWSFAAFKVKGGANAYFHGGLSPQELIIPVLSLTSRQPDATELIGDIAWTLVLGSDKISTRFFSSQVKGAATGLFGFETPKVRLEIRAQGKSISVPISASYGFEEGTGNVQMKAAKDSQNAVEPNTITLMITEDVTQKYVAIHLLNAASGVELARLERIEVVISL